MRMLVTPAHKLRFTSGWQTLDVDAILKESKIFDAASDGATVIRGALNRAPDAATANDVRV